MLWRGRKYLRHCFSGAFLAAVIRASLVLLLVSILTASWFSGHWFNSKATNSVDPEVQFGFADPEAVSLPIVQLSEELAGIKATGATWVRYDIDWNAIQPQSSTTYNWTATDQVAAVIKVAGLNGLGVIDYTPPWARSSACAGSDKCEPANDAVFADFAAAVVQRYAPSGLHTWEIWNEENSSEFWQPTTNNIASYAQLLKDTYPKIKRADPQALVLVGGMAGAVRTTASKETAMIDFMNGLYADGDAGYFDAVAAHPYSFPSAPTSANGAWHGLQELHDLMNEHGDGNKKIWITEYGVPSQSSIHPTASEPVQAQFLTTAVKQFESYPWAGNFFWYDYKDAGDSTSDDYYGAVRADGSVKPAYTAYEKAIATSQ